MIYVTHDSAIFFPLDLTVFKEDKRQSKFKSVGMVTISTRIFEDLAQTDAIYLEAVEQACHVFCYHARSKDVMSPKLMSACGPGQWSC